jgi:ketosteroid isomerase-like protein
MADRLELARAGYEAFRTGDPSAYEAMLAEDFVFYAPPDPGIDREGWWERCWPNAGSVTEFSFERLFEHGDEVFVTYEATRKDGSRFRNSEVLTFRGEELVKVEVYFGWDL